MYAICMLNLCAISANIHDDDDDSQVIRNVRAIPIILMLFTRSVIENGCLASGGIIKCAA